MSELQHGDTVYVDSEGTEMGDTTQQPKILALVCLLASEGGVLIQNEVTYSNSGLGMLAVLAATSQIVQNMRADDWPYLCYLVRNFEREMVVDDRALTPDQFFEYLLTTVNDRHDTDREVCALLLLLHQFVISPTNHIISPFSFLLIFLHIYIVDLQHLPKANVACHASTQCCRATRSIEHPQR